MYWLALRAHYSVAFKIWAVLRRDHLAVWLEPFADPEMFRAFCVRLTTSTLLAEATPDRGGAATSLLRPA